MHPYNAQMGLDAATIHVSRDQNHLAWDPAIPPVASVGSGDVVEFDCLDASFGQLTAESTNDDARDARLRPGRPGHRAGRGGGRRAGRHAPDRPARLRAGGLGLDGLDPRLRAAGRRLPRCPSTRSRASTAGADRVEFWPGIRIPLAPFCGEIGVAPDDGAAARRSRPTSTAATWTPATWSPARRCSCRCSTPGRACLDRRRPRHAGRRRGVGHGHRDADAGARPAHRAQGPAPRRGPSSWRRPIRTRRCATARATPPTASGRT